jgi:protein-disulfide isomerase
MKIGVTQIILILVIAFGGGGLIFLASQKSTDVEAKYKEIVDVFEIAREQQLDMEKFKNDIDSEEVHNKIEEDKAEGTELMGGQLSTPSVFVDGARVNIGGTMDDLLALIKSSIEAKLDENPDHKPEVMEFFDFNCIYCARLEVGMNKIAEEFGDKITYHKKYLPFLRSSSTTYVYAAEAANRQGRLIEFSEELFRRIHGDENIESR